MVCCTAWGCANRSEKGVKMYSFPEEEQRRRKWLVQVSRSNLVLKTAKNRKLCQAHFEADQFVETKNGKRRLTADAIPTIFVHRPVLKRRRPPAPPPTPAPINIQAVAADHSYGRKRDAVSKAEERDEETDGRAEDGAELTLVPSQPASSQQVPARPSEPAASQQVPVSPSEPASSQQVPARPSEPASSQQVPARPSEPASSQQVPVSQHPSEPAACPSDLLKRLKRQEKISIKAKASLRKVRKENAALRRTMDIRDRNLKKTFTQDQMKALGRTTTKGMKWSRETLEKASRILSTAGPAGYQTLQESHFPLPSIRTLQRQTRGVTFEPGAPTGGVETEGGRVDAFGDDDV